MQKTKQLNKLVLLAWPVMAMLCTGVNAAEPPPAPVVMETYTCNLNEGKAMKDLMSARDYYVKQAEKAGIKLGASYLLTMFKGNLPFDLVWMTPHANLAAFAAATEAEIASADMAGVGARFDAVVDCTANLNVLNPIFQKEGNEPNDEPGFVSAFACRTATGVGPVHVQDLRNHVADVVSGIGDQAPNLMFTLTPMTRGPDSPDVIMFAANDSISAWANFSNAVRNSPGGPNLGRHFQAVADCDLALWNSQRVIAPME